MSVSFTEMMTAREELLKKEFLETNNWPFDPISEGFTIGKRLRDGVVPEFYFAKYENIKRKNIWGQTLTDTINYWIRKFGNKYRIKASFSKRAYLSHGDEVTERMWDCVISNQEMFKQTLKEIYEEVSK